MSAYVWVMQTQTDKSEYHEVLEFWFDGTADAPDWSPEFRDAWFFSDPDFDATIKDRFGETHTRAARGDLDDWTGDPLSALALVLVLDQFPRNLFRGTAQAFATDQKALDVAVGAINRGFDKTVPKFARMFFYMPFEHSEALAIQERSLELFSALNDDSLFGFAKDHHEVVARFGRFPHRNDILGRSSTPDEVAFMAGEGGAFHWADPSLNAEK